MKYRLAHILAGLLCLLGAAGLFSCNTETLPAETEILIFSPVTLDSSLDEITVAIHYQGRQTTLFSGRKNDPDFHGPWTVTFPEFKAESLNLVLAGKAADGSSPLHLRIPYRVFEGKLVPDTSMQFLGDSLSVPLSRQILKLKWLSLPAAAGLIPTFETSRPQIAGIFDSTSLRLLDTGTVLVFLKASGTSWLDTLLLRIRPDAAQPPTGEIRPDSIRLFADSLQLALGIETYPLTWTVYPKKSQADVTCKSLNPGIVAMKGVAGIMPIASGNAKIVCAVNDSLADTLHITVPEPVTQMPLDSIRLKSDGLTLKLGDSGIQAEYDLYPAFPDAQIIWSAGGNSIKVNADGWVTPVAPGSTYLKAFAIGSKVVSDSIPVTVLDTVRMARWKNPILVTQVKEGQSISFDLKDSIANPSYVPVDFLYPGSDPRIGLKNGIFQFTAGLPDSGIYPVPIHLKQGDSISPVTVEIHVMPVYFSLRIDALNGTVTALPSKAVYRSGEKVVLTPLPSQGYGFTQWQGDTSGTTFPLTLAMNADKRITAIFSLVAAAGCVSVATGESLNAAIFAGYSKPTRPYVICPPNSGRFDNGTIQTLGKVEIQLNR